MSKRRVVVTGMGIVSPVGIGLDAAWTDILAAKSGITAITRFDASGFPSRIAGEVKNFDVTQYLSGKEARRYDTFIHYGLVATKSGGSGFWNFRSRRRPLSALMAVTKSSATESSFSSFVNDS